jgi:hypothetical protein
MRVSRGKSTRVRPTHQRRGDILVARSLPPATKRKGDRNVAPP